MKYERGKYNDCTGKISKIVLLTELPGLEILFKPAKGFLSQYTFLLQ
jgi:hypothetical protein